METAEWNAVLPQAPICCLGPRQLKKTSHSPILTGSHAIAQGKMKMPAPCLKCMEFQDRESRELNQAQRPAHLHRPPTTTPPRLGGTSSHSCWAQFSRQNVPLLLLPREALPLPLCGWGLPDLTSPDPILPHCPPAPNPASGNLTQHELCHRSWSISRLFRIIVPPSPRLFSFPILHSTRTCCSSVLQLATGLGQWTPLMLVFGFAFKPLGIILPAPLKARAQRIAHIENTAVRNQPACPLEKHCPEDAAVGIFTGLFKGVSAPRFQCHVHPFSAPATGEMKGRV